MDDDREKKRALLAGLLLCWTSLFSRGWPWHQRMMNELRAGLGPLVDPKEGGDRIGCILVLSLYLLIYIFDLFYIIRRNVIIIIITSSGGNSSSLNLLYSTSVDNVIESFQLNEYIYISIMKINWRKFQMDGYIILMALARILCQYHLVQPLTIFGPITLYDI